jgi:hypothetical protein
MTDALEQIDVIGPVIPPAAAALHRFDLREPCFPETQDMLGQIEVVCDLTYRPKCVRAFFQIFTPIQTEGQDTGTTRTIMLRIVHISTA